MKSRSALKKNYRDCNEQRYKKNQIDDEIIIIKLSYVNWKIIILDILLKT